MSYCQQLFEKLNSWQNYLQELDKAKDAYLEVFDNSAKKEHEEKKELVLAAERQYWELKENCYVEVDTFDLAAHAHKKEKLFGPDYGILNKIFGGLGIGSVETRKPIAEDIKNGRISSISIGGRPVNLKSEKIMAALSHVKYLTGLEKFNFSNSNLPALPELPPNLEYLWCSGNKSSLRELPDLRYLTKLRLFFCDNNEITEFPLLPVSIEGINIRRTPLADHLRLDDKDTREELEKIKRQYPNCHTFYY